MSSRPLIIPAKHWTMMFSALCTKPSSLNWERGDALSTKADAQALVEVEIIDFHMRNQASRWMLGAMSGKDFIKSKISLVEPGTGAILLSFEVTTSTANQWRGQNSIARLHAEEIAKALAQRTNQG
jgi:hypothetical protein